MFSFFIFFSSSFIYMSIGEETVLTDKITSLQNKGYSGFPLSSSSFFPDFTSDVWWIKWQRSKFFPSCFAFALFAGILPLHYTHSSLPPGACDSPDQAEYCYILSP
jgi:hypothetical protein